MSVCIPITDEYRLTSDSVQWIVHKHGGHYKDGSIKWNAIGFYVSAEHAINKLHQRMLRDSDATTLIELRKTAESIASLLSRAHVAAIEVSDAVLDDDGRLVSAV